MSLSAHDAMSDPQTIPRLLHFIWLGGRPPTEVLSRIERFSELNPRCEVKLWQDGDLAWLRNRAEFDAAPTWQGRANIARYEILEREGGYYLDTDFEPQRSLNPVLALARGRQVVFSTERSDVLNNAFLGSVPHSPLLQMLVEALPERLKHLAKLPSQVASGPSFLTQVGLAYMREHPDDCAVVPRDWLYPYSYDKHHRRKGPWSAEVVAVHLWAQAYQGPSHVLLPSPVSAAADKGRRHLHPRRALAQAQVRLRRVRARRAFRPNAVTTQEGTAMVVDRVGNPLMTPLSDLDAVAHLIVDGVYDPNFHAFLRRVLRGSDVYVDVGANIGQFVVTAAQSLSDYGRVYAYEPNPEIFALLQKNIYMNRMRGSIQCEVETLNLAMGSEAGTAELRIPRHLAGRGTLRVDGLSDVAPADVTSIQVPVRRLDDTLGHLSHIRLLKVDVEGFEVDVLTGGAGLIEGGFVDYVDVEFLPEHLGASMDSLVDVLELWASRGARLWTLRRWGRLQPLHMSELKADRPSLSHLIIQLPAAFRQSA